MSDLFAAVPEEPAPPLRAGYLDGVLVRGRRSVRRRRAGAAAAWTLAVLALVAVLLPGVPPPARPAAPPPQAASVPDRFAGYSLLTSTAERSAPGRAIAIYGFGNGETFNMFQQLVVGADQDTYRRVGAYDERGGALGLLSPDGTRVLLGDDRGMTADLVLVDLTTGERRSIGLGSRVAVRLLAWSPDGRQVAYSATTVAPRTDTGESFDWQALQDGTLRLLDLATGAGTTPALAGHPSFAAFSPDGARLAVQVAGAVHLLRPDGSEDGIVAVGSGESLAAGVGWSPDGRFLAVTPWDGTLDHGTFLWENKEVHFVPIASGGVVPAPVADVVRVLGWRDPGHMIAATAGADGRIRLVEVDLATGARTVLARFDEGRTCEFGTQPCQVFDLQLASGLLAGLHVRAAGSPDRGPWPWALRLLVAVPIAAAAVVALLVLLLRRRRSRPPARPAR